MSDIHTISYDSELYPPLLREIAQPPRELYVRGAVEVLKHPHLLAVVGSRKASAYGKHTLNLLLPPVLKMRVYVVSGLAYGIDAGAARVSVEQAVPTIAVLGSGIDDHAIYPHAHLSLAHQILRTGGALVSEYAAGTAAYKGNFPARNRIIAGLSTVTLLVQAARQSGSLITARHALEANRDVCAVPGAITDPLSAGTNDLIKQGAQPVTSADDLLHIFGFTPAEHTAAHTAALSDSQKGFLAKLSATPQHIDELTVATALPPAQVSALLAELELMDCVQHVGGMKYVKV